MTPAPPLCASPPPEAPCGSPPAAPGARAAPLPPPMPPPPMPLSMVRSVARQLLEALETLDSLGMMHGDIKPENVLIGAAAPADHGDPGAAAAAGGRGAEAGAAGVACSGRPRGGGAAAMAGNAMLEAAAGAAARVASAPVVPSGSQQQQYQPPVKVKLCDFGLASCLGRTLPSGGSLWQDGAAGAAAATDCSSRGGSSNSKPGSPPGPPVPPPSSQLEAVVHVTAQPLGAPLYAAPEQAEGRRSARSDVFAVGAVVCELLTGQPPAVHGGWSYRFPLGLALLALYCFECWWAVRGRPGMMAAPRAGPWQVPMDEADEAAAAEFLARACEPDPAARPTAAELLRTSAFVQI